MNAQLQPIDGLPWRVALAAVAALVAVAAWAQTSAVDEIAKYRAALQDGNPAELWEVRGEGLWRRRGPSWFSSSDAT
jgi:sulfur-oxidizing protein SoxA